MGSPDADKYKDFKPGSDELTNALVQENLGWAEAIARSVARAWNLDWQLDGLDGGAFEALLFCSRRYDPSMGVPFRAYARKRIHEASTEEARKSKAWQRGVGSGTTEEQEAREISFRLFEMFPELREGYLPASEEEGGDVVRGAIRQMLTSATVMSAFQEGGQVTPETAVDYKSMLEKLAELEPVHQAIIWAIYWGGQSMRSLADEWGIDELTVIREHREILGHVLTRMSTSRAKSGKRLKIRPSLRTAAQNLRRKKFEPPFGRFAQDVSTSGLLLLICIQFAVRWH